MKGTVVGINGNMVTVQTEDNVLMNEVAYIQASDSKLKSEVIRIRGKEIDLQVFEITKGLKVGNEVDFSGDLLSVELGPGVLTRIYDGLQNPLPELAEQCGFFLDRGIYLEALDVNHLWSFTPKAKEGDKVVAGDTLGTVPEGVFEHKIMVPFHLKGEFTVVYIAVTGKYNIRHVIARVKDENGIDSELTMSFRWPVKRPIKLYSERLKPVDPMVTQVRTVDTFFPVAKGGTYCTPGPFGAGKTVLQQVTSRNADVDIVIITACGERAGEVVETLKEFPELTDPRTGKSLMERTVIICNTSSMPVAAREASVYTGATIAEYYRQMGLHVLLLADSTSRWAQAMREMSGRLEEIPGEEGFPAYLESSIAAFYERAGIVRLKDGSLGSVTIGGTVSPAGGNFEEPVTQATLKVVGAFHGLSRERSDARKYPAINPTESWSKYPSVINEAEVEYARSILIHGYEVAQMMKVVGEEGTSLRDFITFLKSDLIDSAYLQQNSFDEFDVACSIERQKYMFNLLFEAIGGIFLFKDKEEARNFFNNLRQIMLDMNTKAFHSSEFNSLEERYTSSLLSNKEGDEKEAKHLKEGRG